MSLKALEAFAGRKAGGAHTEVACMEYVFIDGKGFKII